MIFDRSEERDTPCLGLSPGSFAGFPPGTGLKVPHMGWNAMHFTRQHPVFDGIPQDTSFYFVHSYYPDPVDTGLVAAETEYGGEFPSCIARGNLVAFQCHVEKSGPHRAEASEQLPLLGRDMDRRHRHGRQRMLEKRVIVCLDVKDGRTTKGIKFKDNVDVGDPVAMAQEYYEQGVDELVFYDITASAERRAIRIDTVRRVAENVFIPFSVGRRHLHGGGDARGAPGRRGEGERELRRGAQARRSSPAALRCTAASASCWAWTSRGTRRSPPGTRW